MDRHSINHCVSHIDFKNFVLVIVVFVICFVPNVQNDKQIPVNEFTRVQYCMSSTTIVVCSFFLFYESLFYYWQYHSLGFCIFNRYYIYRSTLIV
jgi:uncharacterized membrane protein YciS (DUF1049 family)